MAQNQPEDIHSHAQSLCKLWGVLSSRAIAVLKLPRDLKFFTYGIKHHEQHPCTETSRIAIVIQVLGIDLLQW